MRPLVAACGPLDDSDLYSSHAQLSSNKSVRALTRGASARTRRTVGGSVGAPREDAGAHTCAAHPTWGVRTPTRSISDLEKRRARMLLERAGRRGCRANQWVC